jgi:hypothetical protein
VRSNTLGELPGLQDQPRQGGPSRSAACGRRLQLFGGGQCLLVHKRSQEGTASFLW